MVPPLNAMALPANSGTLLSYRVPPSRTIITTTIHPRTVLLVHHHSIEPRCPLTVRQLTPMSFLLTALRTTTTVLPKVHFTPAVPTNAAILNTMTRDTTVVRDIVMIARIGIRFVPTVAAMGGRLLAIRSVVLLEMRNGNRFDPRMVTRATFAIPTTTTLAVHTTIHAGRSLIPTATIRINRIHAPHTRCTLATSPKGSMVHPKRNPYCANLNMVVTLHEAFPLPMVPPATPCLTSMSAMPSRASLRLLRRNRRHVRQLASHFPLSRVPRSRGRRSVPPSITPPKPRS